MRFHLFNSCALCSAILQGSAKLEKAEILQMTVEHLKMLHAAGGKGTLDFLNTRINNHNKFIITVTCF